MLLTCLQCERMIREQPVLNTGSDLMLRATMWMAVLLGAMSASSATAAILYNSQGAGGDLMVQRNSASAQRPDGLVLIKIQSGDAENNNNDRLGLLKFDLTQLPAESIATASIRISLPRGAATAQPNNAFAVGDSLYLYGVPNGSAGENFTLDTSTTFANFPYFTGPGSVANPRPVTDLTANGVNDSLVPLLATHTFTSASDAGQFVDFHSSALTSFLQADSNGIATFILTTGGQTLNPATKTPTITSGQGDLATNNPTWRPALLTNADAVVPEPTSIALLLLGATGASVSRRRHACQR